MCSMVRERDQKKESNYRVAELKSYLIPCTQLLDEDSKERGKTEDGMIYPG